MTQDDFDQVWDENQWEQHLLNFESESDRLRKFINATWGETTPAWERLMQEYATKTDVVDAYVEEELMFEESAFPDDDDDFGDDDDDDFDDEFFLYDEDDADDEDDDGEEEHPFGMGGLQALEDGKTEDTFSLAGLDANEDPDLHLYDRSRAIGAEILSWREQFGSTRPPAEVDVFITGVLQLSAKLAAAYWFGYEISFIGANIAYTKKALNLASSSLERLRQLHLNGIISRTTYVDFSEKLHDLRNDTGLAIQDMRDAFRNG